MFNSIGSILGFLAGVALTVGLLLSPHLVPGGRGNGAGFALSPLALVLLFAGGLGVLSLVLWTGGRMIAGARRWKEPRVIAAAVLIALVANTLYMFLVELFDLHSGMRALIAVIGVPVIYGNLGAVLGRTSLRQSMLSILAGALATMGAGFIIAALVRGW